MSDAAAASTDAAARADGDKTNGASTSAPTNGTSVDKEQKLAGLFIKVLLVMQTQ